MRGDAWVGHPNGGSVLYGTRIVLNWAVLVLVYPQKFAKLFAFWIFWNVLGSQLPSTWRSCTPFVWLRFTAGTKILCWSESRINHVISVQFLLLKHSCLLNSGRSISWSKGIIIWLNCSRDCMNSNCSGISGVVCLGSHQTGFLNGGGHFLYFPTVPYLTILHMWFQLAVTMLHLSNFNWKLYNSYKLEENSYQILIIHIWLTQSPSRTIIKIEKLGY